MKSRFATSALLALVLLAAAAAPASAQLEQERFRLDLGGFFQQYDSNLRYDSGSAFPGTPVNAERDLGLGDNQVSFRADGHWRFGRHGALEFAYTGNTRSGSKTIDRDITYGGTTYHAGATVDAKLGISLAELYYGYSFVNNEKLEAGLSLGVSSYFVNAKLEGNGTVSGGGQSGTASYSTESKSFVAPIPAFGARLRYTVVPGVDLYGRVRGLKGTISGYYGSMVDWRAGADWRFSNHFGVGAAYQYVKIVFEHSEDRTVRAEFGYDGPLGYVSLWF